MAFQEFYCDTASGSNLNAGSTTSASAVYTSPTNGGWVTGTPHVFTPVSGNPSALVAIGDWVSVYADGSTVTGFVGQVTAVSTTTISVSATIKSGTPPTTAGTGMSCKAGGAWKGPNAAVNFPFGFVQATMTPTAANLVRVNFKSGTNYAIITPGITHNIAGPVVFQGYTASPGDGGRAIIDGGTSGTSYVLLTLDTLANNILVADMILQNNGATANGDGVSLKGNECVLGRVTVLGVRGNGVATTGGANILVECEAGVGTAGGSGAGFYVNPGNNAAMMLVRCIAHDAIGAAGHGFSVASGVASFLRCIADKNAQNGFHFTGNNGITMISCNSNNNVGHGLNFAPASSANLLIENSNFTVNGTSGTIYGVNIATSPASITVLYNCGFYGNFTASVGGTPTANVGAVDPYTATPYPGVGTGTTRTGDFAMTDALGKGTGRGNFTQSAATYTTTTTQDYPDIGAAQHQEVAGGGGGGFISG